MLAIVSGIQNAGADYLLKLLQSLLEMGGHCQKRWRAQHLPDLEKTEGVLIRRTGSMEMGFHRALWPALHASGLDTWHAMKTHGSLTPKCSAAMELGLVRAVTLWRDPLESAAQLLSDVDSQLVSGAPFGRRLAHILTLQDAIDHVAPRLPAAEGWLRDKRVLKVGYDEFRRSPAQVCRSMAGHFGIRCENPDAVVAAAAIRFDERKDAQRFLNKAADMAYAQKRFHVYRSLMPIKPAGALGGESAGEPICLQPALGRGLITSDPDAD